MTIMTIDAGCGVSLTLKAKQTLRIIDPMGGQSGDLMAYRDGDITEWLSSGRSFDYGGTICLTTGHTLYSNKSNPMLTIVRDDVGRHDFLYASCSPEMYRIQHGTADHKNCLTNIADALAHMGIEAYMVPTAFNFFMNACVSEDGRLTIRPPVSQAGDSIDFRAEMDLAVAVTSCPAPTCTRGPVKPIQFEVRD